MRSRLLAGLFATLSLVAAAPAPAATQAAGPTVHAACTRATVEGDRRCIGIGQFCRHRRSANRDYHRYGLHCGKRDRNGSYHLVSH